MARLSSPEGAPFPDVSCAAAAGSCVSNVYALATFNGAKLIAYCAASFPELVFQLVFWRMLAYDICGFLWAAFHAQCGWNLFLPLKHTCFK
jgi:hypothetical protein